VRLQADEYCITRETTSQITVSYRFDARRPEIRDLHCVVMQMIRRSSRPVLSTTARLQSAGRSSAETASQGFLSLGRGEQISVVHADPQAFCAGGNQREQLPSRAMRTIPLPTERMHVQREFLISSATSDLEVHGPAEHARPPRQGLKLSHRAAVPRAGKRAPHEITETVGPAPAVSLVAAPVAVLA
jgi:hypothetical protein